MRLPRSLVRAAPPALFAVVVVACGAVPDDPGARLVPPGGIIRGTVVYQGPRPCSRNGHIVGNAILLVFDRRNPPPPNGVANTAVDFADVTGDRLFGNEPRYTGPTTYCPADHGFTATITASAPFEIGALGGGSYIVQSFFDYTGDFLPSFKIRNLPERGDIGGGYLDTADALNPINAGNPNYQPKFLPVDVGVPIGLPSGAPPQAISSFVIPSTGFVADNITVTVGSPLGLARPYFYPQGGGAFRVDPATGNPAIVYGGGDQSSDVPGHNPSQGPGPFVSGTLENHDDPDGASYEPILTIPQDLQVPFGPPNPRNSPMPPVVAKFEASFPHLRLVGGVPAGDGEAKIAADPAQPFHMQLPGGSGFAVWQNQVNPTGGQYVAQTIAEGQIPYLWPLVVLSKLVDEPPSPACASKGDCQYHPKDPASLTAQGDPTHPVILLQAITLLGTQTRTPQGVLLPTPQPESIFWSTLSGTPSLWSLAQGFFGELPNPLVDSTTNRPVVYEQDHLTVLLRPSVVCLDSLFDPTNPDKRGTLVTTTLRAPAADDPTGPPVPLLPPNLLTRTDPTFASIANLVKPAPDGGPAIQGCLPTGRYAISVVYPDGQAWTVPNEAGACSGDEGATDYRLLTCTAQPRPILYSQGTRAVVEIVGAKDPSFCREHPVPRQCLPAAP